MSFLPWKKEKCEKLVTVRTVKIHDLKVWVSICFKELKWVISVPQKTCCSPNFSSTFGPRSPGSSSITLNNSAIAPRRKCLLSLCMAPLGMTQSVMLGNLVFAPYFKANSINIWGAGGLCIVSHKSHLLTKAWSRHSLMSATRLLYLVNTQKLKRPLKFKDYSRVKLYVLA